MISYTYIACLIVFYGIPLTIGASTQEIATTTEHPSTTYAQDHTTVMEQPSTSSMQEPQRGLFRSSNQSYVVVLDLWEQLLAGSTSFIQLLCWAEFLHGAYPVSVVEPSTGLHSNSSRWGFSFGNFSNDLPKLSDVFDMRSWYGQWHTSWGTLSPITLQNKFLWEIKHFEMNVILVQFQYEQSSQKSCDFTWNNHIFMDTLKLYPLLKISRKVCINVNPIKSSELRDFILGDSEARNTVIIVMEWRGLGIHRVNIQRTVCTRVPKYGALRPSAQIVEEAETYANKYLGGFGKYISVIARFEKLSKPNPEISQEKRRQEVLLAINNATIKVDSLKEKGHVDRVYLSYDYGKFGSRTFLEKDFYNSSDLLVKFQQDLYDGSLSYNDYENSFMTLKWQNAGYIAMTQMTIASKGKCLLKIGTGHCIEFVASLFEAFHDSSSCSWLNQDTPL